MKPTLLFITKMDFGIKHNAGVRKKVFAQKKAFQALGFSVCFVYKLGRKVIIEKEGLTNEYSFTNPLSYQKFLFWDIVKDLDLDGIHYVYVRHFLLNPLFLLFLKRIRNVNDKLKIYMEIPTFPYIHTYRGMGVTKRLEASIDQWVVKRLHKYIDKIVTYAALKEIWGIPTIQTDNGIDPEVFLPVTKNKKNGDLVLTGIANIQKWHGYDRLIVGLHEYYKNDPKIKVVFKIVGGGAELRNLQSLAQELKMTAYVQFTGFLDGDELISVLQDTDVGVSNLAFHRIGAAKGETSALKSREFASRGIPFITAYIDRGFPENYPFYLDFPADESPIEVAKIISFYQGLEMGFQDKLRNYAKENLSWEAKLAEVKKNFLS